MFSVHHAGGRPAQYSEGRVLYTSEIGGVADFFVYNALMVDWSRGMIEGGASGAGLFLEEGLLVGVLSGSHGPCSDLSPNTTAGPFRDFFPQIHQWLDPASYEPEPVTHMLPALLGAGGSPQGFVRIMNDSDRSGEVEIHAIDDAGQRYGPVTLAIGALQTRHFNSEDLERGAPSKGLFGGVGDGTGMWRLELKTTLDINPRAYIRTPDGFVTSMHQVAGSHPGDSIIVDPQRVSYVPFFNPGSNTAIRSLLRVINPNAHEVHVEIEATDDDGNLGEAEVVTFYLAANSAMQISSQTFEAPRRRTSKISTTGISTGNSVTGRASGRSPSAATPPSTS